MSPEPFADWWTRWFGLAEAPKWLTQLWPLPPAKICFGKAVEKLSPPPTPPQAPFLRKTRRFADDFPTRRAKTRARKRLQQNGWVTVCLTKAIRRLNPDTGRKEVVETHTVRKIVRCGNAEKVHVLDYRVSVDRRSDRVFRTLKDDQGAITGYLVILDTLTLPSQEAILARAEQDEKSRGLEVTNGLSKPGWMTEEEWQARQSDPLFQVLNNDWTQLAGIRNPDLNAKFSAVDPEGWRRRSWPTARQTSAPSAAETEREKRAQVLAAWQRLQVRKSSLVYSSAGKFDFTIGRRYRHTVASRFVEQHPERKVKPWQE